MADADLIFAPEFKETPYWWGAVSTAEVNRGFDANLPRAVDVAVVGGGLTGVAAAYKLARAGRDVLVLDAGEPGRGASSRNHGMLGRTFRHSLKDLKDQMGLDAATNYFREVQEAYDAAMRRIEDEALDCQMRRCGRFIGALSPAHYERLAREYDLRARHLGEDVEILPYAKQVEIDSVSYCGGVVIHDNAAIHPALYHGAMRRRAERNGARVVGHVAVTAIRPDAGRFELQTTRGELQARDVLIATNGHTEKLTPWLSKRLLPINAYTIATEPLPEHLAKTMLPKHRIYHDNRKLSNPFFLAPDGSNRLIFSGRPEHRPASLQRIAEKIHQDMLSLLPQLRGVRLTHAWVGRCAGTRDLFPHTGVHDGMHYSLGYCFSGNAMAPHLGTKAAFRILGSPKSRSNFESLDFPRFPLPVRGDWFGPFVMKYYAWRDRREAARRH